VAQDDSKKRVKKKGDLEKPKGVIVLVPRKEKESKKEEKGVRWLGYSGS